MYDVKGKDGAVLARAETLQAKEIYERYFSGQSIEKIAKEVGVTISAVKGLVRMGER